MSFEHSELGNKRQFQFKQKKNPIRQTQVYRKRKLKKRNAGNLTISKKKIESENETKSSGREKILKKFLLNIDNKKTKKKNKSVFSLLF